VHTEFAVVLFDHFVRDVLGHDCLVF
jgi:hypothetical protein